MEGRHDYSRGAIDWLLQISYLNLKMVLEVIEVEIIPSLVYMDCFRNDQELFITFIDLKKAFDLVCRYILWLILQMLGVPELFINLLINLHMNSTANFRFNGVIYPTVIPLSAGLKQGCVAAPILFLIFFSAIFSFYLSILIPPSSSALIVLIY